MSGKMLLTTEEAAEFVGMSVAGFRRAVRRTKTLKRHSSSSRSRHYYLMKNLLAWLEETDPSQK